MADLLLHNIMFVNVGDNSLDHPEQHGLVALVVAPCPGCEGVTVRGQFGPWGEVTGLGVEGEQP